jgi:hypothetical protein
MLVRAVNALKSVVLPQFGVPASAKRIMAPCWAPTCTRDALSLRMEI